MKKKVIILLLALILIGSVSTLILYNIGGYFLDSALEMGNTTPTLQADAFQSELPASEEMETQNASEDTDNDAEKETLPAVIEPDGQKVASEESEAQQEQEIISVKPEASTNSIDEKNVTYSSDEMTDIKNSITASDKIAASVLVLSKLSAEDIQYLYGLLEGGLTSEEKAAAKDLCYSRFSKDEVAQIYEFYSKYTK